MVFQSKSSTCYLELDLATRLASPGREGGHEWELNPVLLFPMMKGPSGR